MPRAVELGQLPFVWMARKSTGELIELLTFNGDGTVTFHTDTAVGDLSAAELGVLDAAIADVEWAVAAGGANVCVFTGTIKDAAGNTIAAIRELDVYISEDATGIGVSADSYSTGAAITDGTGTEIVAEKVFKVQTGADGVFAISITDSGTPADQYGVAVIPATGELAVSAASAALWGA